MLKLVMLALALGGCSFVIVRGPAQPRRDARCTESRIVPIVDAAVASLAAVGAVVGLSAHSTCPPDQDCLPENIGAGIAHGAGVGFALTAAVYAFSTLYGFSTTSECRRVHALPAPPQGAPGPETGAPAGPASL